MRPLASVRSCGCWRASIYHRLEPDPADAEPDECRVPSLVALRLDRGATSKADCELTVLPNLDETVPSAGPACPYCANHVRDSAAEDHKEARRPLRRCGRS